MHNILKCIITNCRKVYKVDAFININFFTAYGLLVELEVIYLHIINIIHLNAE